MARRPEPEVILSRQELEDLRQHLTKLSTPGLEGEYQERKSLLLSLSADTPRLPPGQFEVPTTGSNPTVGHALAGASADSETEPIN